MHREVFIVMYYGNIDYIYSMKHVAEDYINQQVSEGQNRDAYEIQAHDVFENL